MVVEDERNLGGAIVAGFEAEGCKCSHVTSGEEALFCLSQETFDLLILDIMLPGRSGLEILSLIRKGGSQVPVLLLTAKDRLEDKISGFESGADDYLTKPFAFAELLARSRSLLKRVGHEASLSLQTPHLTIDLLTREVRLKGKKLELTLKEFELLEYLVRHRAEVVSREMLATDVWKESSRSTTLDNVIDVHMARLRKKLEAEFEGQLIHTIRGVGFSFRDEG